MEYQLYYIPMRKHAKILLNNQITFFWVLIVLIVSICKVFFQVDPIHDGTFYSSGFALNNELKLYSEVATSYGPVTHLLSAAIIFLFGNALVLHRITWLVIQLLIVLLTYKILMIKFNKNTSISLAFFVLLFDPSTIGFGFGFVNPGRYWPNQIIIIMSLITLYSFSKIDLKNNNPTIFAYIIGLSSSIFPFIRAQSTIVTFFVIPVSIILFYKNKKNILYFFMGLITGFISLTILLYKFMNFKDFFKQTILIPLEPTVQYSKFDFFGSLKLFILIILTFILVAGITIILRFFPRISTKSKIVFFVALFSLISILTVNPLPLHASYKNPFFLILTLVKGSSFALIIILYMTLLYLALKNFYRFRSKIFLRYDPFYIFSLFIFIANIFAIYPKNGYFPYLLPLIAPFLFELVPIYKNYRNLFSCAVGIAVISVCTITLTTFVYSSYSYSSNNLKYIKSTSSANSTNADKEIEFLSNFSNRGIVWGTGCYELMSAITGNYLPKTANYGPDIPYSPKIESGELNLICGDEKTILNNPSYKLVSDPLKISDSRSLMLIHME